MSLLPLSQSWSLADSAYYRHLPAFPSKGSAQEQHEWREKEMYPRDRRLAQAIGEHMALLMTQGHAVMPPHTDVLETNFLYALRKLQENPTDDWAQRDVGDYVLRLLRSDFFFEHRGTKELSDENFHAKVVAHLEEGTFGEGYDPKETCFKTGANLQVRFRQWQGIAGVPSYRFSEEKGRDTFFFDPIEDGQFEDPKARTAPFPMPSGKLWICDWVRIPAFNTLTKRLDDEDFEAIRSDQGRAKICGRYLEEYGVAYVPFQSPTLVSSKGAVTGGKLHQDKHKEYIEPAGTIGNICASLRWTTLVDRQHLVTLLTPELGAEEAEAQVAAYEQNERELLVVDVNPGTHHFYWGGAHGEFKQALDERFQADGLFLGEDYQYPGFALTEEPLLAIEPKAKRRRKPGR